MNWIINLVGKWTGLSALWNLTDGYKAKGTALIAALTGLATLLAQFFGLPHDVMAYFAFFKGLVTNPAYLMLMSGLYGLGIAHKMDKTGNAPTTKNDASGVIKSILIVALLLGITGPVLAAPAKVRPLDMKKFSRDGFVGKRPAKKAATAVPVLPVKVKPVSKTPAKTPAKVTKGK